jgi:8-amino-7-oxononanoate synthase
MRKILRQYTYYFLTESGMLLLTFITCTLLLLQILMQNLPASLIQKLEERIAQNALRQTNSIGGLVDFSSNDYLGFAQSKELFEATHKYLIDYNSTHNGATGSRLITGNHSLYDRAEDTIAAFHGVESALIFNSGYDANTGFFSSVPQKGDIVLYDEYIHASIRDGIKLGNASAYKFPHNDAQGLYKLIERHRPKAQELYVVTESVFSMDGDTPNLSAFADAAKRYKCRLVVDEAHALGVFGHKGEGLLRVNCSATDVFARIVTFGKGLGCHGAAILGVSGLKTFLINFARSFIYTTALPPHSLAAIISAYTFLQQQEAPRLALHHITMHFKWETERLGLPFILSFSAIHCLVVPGNERVKNIAQVLQQAGFGVKPILSPTVPQGQERLRFCLHSFNTKEQVTQVLELLTQALLSSGPA